MRREALTRSSYARAKSPTPGRSILMTRAPRSASCRVQNGAAIACSSVTTVMPSRGSHGGFRHQKDRGKPSTCSATYAKIRFVEIGATW